MIDDAYPQLLAEIRDAPITPDVAFSAIRAAYAKGYMDSLGATWEERATAGCEAAESANRALAHVIART